MSKIVRVVNIGSSSFKEKYFSVSDKGEIESNERHDEVDIVLVRLVHFAFFHPFQCVLRWKDLSPYEIEKLSTWAPLHNPLIIRWITEYLIHRPTMVGSVYLVSDSALFRDLPSISSTFAIPGNLQGNGCRVYGFHGLAYSSVLRQWKRHFGGVGGGVGNLILIHLGGGCSMTCIVDGKPVDTSMTLGTSDGLMMMTRSGTVGNDVQRFVSDYNLNHRSGLYGITGLSDMRDIERVISNTEDPNVELCIFGLDMFIRSIVKYFGAYYALLGGKVHGIVLSGGIGYNSNMVLGKLVNSLAWVGINLDLDLDVQLEKSDFEVVSSATSSVIVARCKVDEEYEALNLFIEDGTI